CGGVDRRTAMRKAGGPIILGPEDGIERQNAHTEQRGMLQAVASQRLPGSAELLAFHRQIAGPFRSVQQECSIRLNVVIAAVFVVVAGRQQDLRRRETLAEFQRYKVNRLEHTSA